jgi:predicted metal-dependent enzyme (double-stranded beta helix superfamily)
LNEHRDAIVAGLDRLPRFIAAADALVAADLPEAQLLAQLAPLLQELVQHDDWLPAPYARPHPQHYQQYLLHREPAGRFSVVSFVWGPGQKTPVHDHTVWGLVGMLRGAELCHAYTRGADCKLVKGAPERLEPGQVCAVSPSIGDIHDVANALPDQPSISIHVYGADIGAVKRHVFDLESGAVKEFVSGYSSVEQGG